jgi:hypothetical protein
MRLAVASCAATPLVTVPGSAAGADAVSGGLIVGLPSGTSHQRAVSLVQGAGARIERRLDRISALLIGPRHASATKPMAASMVAAAAAMLHAQDSHLTYSDIRSAIKASVVPDAALAGKTVTGGPLNLDEALRQVG